MNIIRKISIRIYFILEKNEHKISEIMEECIICVFKNYLYELPCCKNKLCLSCMKSCKKCPYCQKDIPKKMVRSPELLHLYGQELYNDIPDILWLYECRNNGWWIYDFNHIKSMEEEYQKGLSSLNLYTYGTNLEIDFNSMQQKNTKNDALREIKRIKKSDLDNYLIKGVAGMK